jgi:hypothetical protein
VRLIHLSLFLGFFVIVKGTVRCDLKKKGREVVPMWRKPRTKPQCKGGEKRRRGSCKQQKNRKTHTFFSHITLEG